MPLSDNVIDLSQLPLRLSSRSRHHPSYLQDYVYNLSNQFVSVSSNASNFYWCNFIYDDKIPTSLCESIVEPKSYKEASSNSLWVSAMTKELEHLQNNNTWELVPLPTGKKVISCKWVNKVNLNADDSLERCKVRLVAKRYKQKYGVNYDEVFSPVVKISTIRCIIFLVSSCQN